MVSAKTINEEEECYFPKKIDEFDHSQVMLNLHQKSRSGQESSEPLKRKTPMKVTKGIEFQSNPKYRENIDDFIEDMTNNSNTIEKGNQLN
mmetsp:Transcript_36335/g.55798  ORF Transcript_36335/g.55798 Transcript_36335/m.55798 type:complete len:91 (-) Transcript_36335:289-561(-)